jgi:hypothetical protein
MTNKDVWNQYKEYSQTTSEIARKFAFAGIAICWFFKTDDGIFPESVKFSLLLFLLFFFIDFLQYLISTFLLKFWIRKNEIKIWEETGNIEGDYQKPSYIDTPAFILFVLKIIILFVSFLIFGKWFFNA